MSRVTAAYDATLGGDNKDVFFYESDDAHYVPRAILVDTEPGVLRSIQASSHGRLFNNESIFVAGDGSGAGNNWANGFEQGEAHQERVCDMLDREAEGCDVLDGFQLTHSIAGGTGSGMGSRLLETLRDRHPKQLLQTYSVFPMEDSGVNISPYNAMLAMKVSQLYSTDCLTIAVAADDSRGRGGGAGQHGPVSGGGRGAAFGARRHEPNQPAGRTRDGGLHHHGERECVRLLRNAYASCSCVSPAI
jgi:hypothetical protein